MRRNAKVDVNQPEIVKALRKAGAAVQHCHQLKNAFDILVGFRGQLFIMEIKVPIELKTKENRLPALTAGELKCKELFAKVGVIYHIVGSIDQALKIIGA